MFSPALAMYMWTSGLIRESVESVLVLSCNTGVSPGNSVVGEVVG